MSLLARIPDDEVAALVSVAEDLGDGDVSAALIDADARALGRVITRESGIFCGQAWVEETCRQIDPEITLDFRVSDGDTLEPETLLFTLKGPARALLTAERMRASCSCTRSSSFERASPASLLPA